MSLAPASTIAVRGLRGHDVGGRTVTKAVSLGVGDDSQDEMGDLSRAS